MYGVRCVNNSCKCIATSTPPCVCNGKTQANLLNTSIIVKRYEYFSKEKLIDFTKDIEYNWDEHNGLWSEETNFKNFTPSNWFIQHYLMSHFKKLEQSNE